MNEWMMRLLLEYALPLESHPKQAVCKEPAGFVLDSQCRSDVRQTAFGGDDLDILLSGHSANT